ncbi:GtrA family protein [Candidatus Uhrbacteria bacterium]|nr:GtrA family protein [Candidatus Uhrbacteria bacterium]
MTSFSENGAVRQFVRFGVVGAINTVLDLGVYVALTRHVVFWADHRVGAATVSFTAAVISSFILNTRWTFRRDFRGWPERGVKFFLVAVVGLAINAFVFHLGLTAGFHDIIAKIIATIVVIAWNFTLQRQWTFRV